MAINISQIEENVEALLGNLSHENFIYDLLSAYGQPKASITRLKKGDYNLSKDNGMVLWKKKLCFKHEDQGDLHAKIDELSHDPKITKQHPRFIVVTDFKNLLAADTTTKDTLDIPIEKLNEHCDFFLPWAGMEKSKLQSENPADIKATERMGRLYDLILEDNPIKNEDDRHALNIFFTRLLFCFFAEDTGIFPADKFTNGLASHTAEDGSDLKEYLEKLFEVLNVKDNSAYPSYYREFPYVNGGLFAHESPAPKFSRKSRKIIIECGALNWKAINPDIFGSMMQAVVHTDQRSGMGMHYTSVVNIMKVIEPLFLNDLYEELEKAGEDEKKLRTLLDRIYSIRIFDPACGSGNFLIIAYKELCKLEIQIFKKIYGNQRAFRFESKLQLTQFYGIEIDDFAHETAKLSLWLAEHQMNIAFKEVFGDARPTLPLQDGGNIVCGNSVRIEWSKICPKATSGEVYLLGNPPYLGARNQNAEQKQDIALIFDNHSDYKDSDYVCCWFLKGAEYIAKSNAKLAFVATNSICQGEQVSYLWSRILRHCEVQFAHRSFKWTNSARGNAGVTCVIIGLSTPNDSTKLLFSNDRAKTVKNISPYLHDGRTVLVKLAKEPITPRPKMAMGNMARDGGNLILSIEEYEGILKSSPESEKLLRRLYGAAEFLQGKIRWCIWIEDEDLALGNRVAEIKKRIEATRSFRLASKAKTTQQYATIPHKFAQRSYKQGSKIIIPRVSSERRNYIPFGFLDEECIISDSAQVIYGAPLWLFAVLSSRMHMVWVRAVAGRLKTDYRYSAQLCYNTFPIPSISTTQEKSIEELVYQVLDERELHSEKTISQLYDPDLMPKGLKEAHFELDIGIERCYRSRSFQSDEERLEHLFKLYEEVTKETFQQELINA